jgi:serine O-acetyltransferase
VLETTLPAPRLSAYVAAQLTAFFPDRALAAADLAPHVAAALDRVEHCFSRVVVKRFGESGAATFDHLNTDQYAMFLYLLSNSVHRAAGDPSLAAKLYALNKALHGIDAFYEVTLPDVFVFQHPVGTVLGRAHYADYFAVYQRCAVGSNLDGDMPVFDPGVTMFGGSAVIGRCHVGADACLSVGARVMDVDVPAGSLVFGHSPHLTFKPARRDIGARFFDRHADRMVR